MLTAKLELHSFTNWLIPETPTWGTARRAKAAAALRPYVVHFSGPEAPERAALEQFVKNSFRRTYGAEVKRFMPLLMSLRSHSGDLLAVCGLRRAAGGRLFLENYMKQPIETLLSQRTGQPLARCDVIEIGNLAVANPGMARHLITALI